MTPRGVEKLTWFVGAVEAWARPMGWNVASTDRLYAIGRDYQPF